MNMFKEVNSKVERVVGLARQVPLNIGEWSGVIKLIIVPLYDFDVLLGHEFMKKEKAAPMPHLESLVFLAKRDPIYVRTVKSLPGEWKMTVLAGSPPIGCKET